MCRDNCTDTKVHFTVSLSKAGIDAAQEKGLSTYFKMQSKINTSNMVLFNAAGQIEKYSCPEHILQDFFNLRLEYYEKRRKFLLKDAELQLQRISNKVRFTVLPDNRCGFLTRHKACSQTLCVQVRFILAVISGQLIINNRKRKEIEADLENDGYDKMPKADSHKRNMPQSASADASEEDEAVDATAKSYEYLLSMAISNLTEEKVFCWPLKICQTGDTLLEVQWTKRLFAGESA
jgi:DNA topoisomerase II